MPSRLGVDASRSDLLEVTGGDEAYQGPRHFTIVRVRTTAKLFARVRIVIARDALPKAKLERIQVSFRVVCHVAFIRIDSGRGHPPIPPVFPVISAPVTDTDTDTDTGADTAPAPAPALHSPP